MTATTKAPSIFRYAEAINSGRHDIAIEKDYNPFLITKSFSLFADTLAVAAELNKYSKIPNRNHFHFLAGLIPPRKRWTKWPKQIDRPDLKKLQEKYDLTTAEAEAYSDLIVDK